LLERRAPPVRRARRVREAQAAATSPKSAKPAPLSRELLGATEQPDVVVVVPPEDPAAGASPAPGSVPGSVPAGVAPASAPLPLVLPHCAEHFDATQLASFWRAALVAHDAALSFVSRHS